MPPPPPSTNIPCTSSYKHQMSIECHGSIYTPVFQQQFMVWVAIPCGTRCFLDCIVICISGRNKRYFLKTALKRNNIFFVSEHVPHTRTRSELLFFFLFFFWGGGGGWMGGVVGGWGGGGGKNLRFLWK